jgi:hypothetical protein
VIRAAVATAAPRVVLNRHVCRLKECFSDRGTNNVRGRHSPLITRTQEVIIELIDAFVTPVPIRAAEKSITKLWPINSK